MGIFFPDGNRAAEERVSRLRENGTLAITVADRLAALRPAKEAGYDAATIRGVLSLLDERLPGDGPYELAVFCGDVASRNGGVVTLDGHGDTDG